MKAEKIVWRAMQIALILSAITLVLYAIVGTQARMVADDYCAAFRSLRYGALDATIMHYNTWTARYLDFFLEFSLVPFQPGIYPWIPAVTLLLWMLALGYTVYQILEFLKFPDSRSYTIPITIILTFVFYRIMPSYQHAYWIAAIIPYFWSIIIFVFWLGTVFQYFAKPRSRSTLIRFLVWSSFAMLILGGMIETMITMLGLAFVLMLVAAPLISAERRTEFLSFVLVSGASAGIALLIIVFSPGAWVRHAYGVSLDGMDPSPLDALPNGTLYSLAYTFGEPFGITFGQTFGIAFMAGLFFLGFVWGMFYLERHPEYTVPAPKRLDHAFGLSLLIGVLLIFSIIYPAYYAARGVLPIRPLILPRLVQLSVTVYWTYLAIASAQRHNLLRTLRSAKTWTVILLLISFLFLWLPSVSIYKLANFFTDYRAYAQSWDERHEILSNADSEGLVLVPPLAFDIEEVYKLEKVEADPNFWINGCVREYYGLEAVALDVPLQGE